MVHVFIRHKVEDYESWKEVFDGALEFGKSKGQMSFRLFRNNEDANEVIVISKWDSLENAKGFMFSDELKQKMKEAGVADEPTIYFLDEVE